MNRELLGNRTRSPPGHPAASLCFKGKDSTVNHSVTLFVDDLVTPRPTDSEPWDDRYQVRLSGIEMYGYFTAGEASLIATAWGQLADELHEREVTRLQGLPSQDAITIPITVGEVAQTLDSV